MTRINSAISVRRLTDEHLLAEHREIKRLPKVYLRRMSSKNAKETLPGQFTLGKGHVNFFLDKFKFTIHRYFQIRAECLVRGFTVEDYSGSWADIPPINKIWKDYTPTKVEEELLTDRIYQKIMSSTKKYWHYYGKPISKKKATRILYNKGYDTLDRI